MSLYRAIAYIQRRRAPEANLPLEEAQAIVAEADDHAAAESALDLMRYWI